MHASCCSDPGGLRGIFHGPREGKAGLVSHQIVQGCLSVDGEGHCIFGEKLLLRVKS